MEQVAGGFVNRTVKSYDNDGYRILYPVTKIL